MTVSSTAVHNLRQLADNCRFDKNDMKYAEAIDAVLFELDSLRDELNRAEARAETAIRERDKLLDDLNSNGE